MLYKLKMLLLFPVILTHFPLPLSLGLVVHPRTSNVDSKSEQETQITPKLLSEVAVHGFLFWASMGFLVPVGILIMRKFSKEESEKQRKILFYIHGGLQSLAVLLATIGAIMSFIYFPNSFSNDHQRLGLTLYVLVWLQFFAGIIRPRRGSKGRSSWFLVHWILGTAVSLLGVINVYLGLQAYHKKTSRSVRIWAILFTAEMSLVVLVYLFQERCDYVRKQKLILGNEPILPSEQEILSTDKRKERLADP